MLTDLQCKSPSADGKSKLFDGHGLYLEILKSGARSWRWKNRIHGKEKRLTFGLYPDVSLKKARIARGQVAGDALRVLLEDVVIVRRYNAQPHSLGQLIEPRCDAFELIGQVRVRLGGHCTGSGNIMTHIRYPFT
ncbi:Arm DNA-binding domain-containing protein [Sphingomonas aurantiaca]|uniref:Arm DNA-binding domain-containing protein n=1 Tax=Sphingomonas aurantiaca TaxID=185949 RepID=UPI0033549655